MDTPSQGLVLPRRSGTLLYDPARSDQVRLASRLEGWRPVPFATAIVRDLLGPEADGGPSHRICVADWRIFLEVQHLWESLQRRRGATLALFGLHDPAMPEQALAQLRRFAGAIVCVGAGVAAAHGLCKRLSVPVETALTLTEVCDAVGRFAAAPTRDFGSVQAWLEEAAEHLLRGDDDGAFAAVQRAHAMAPEHPSVLVDVARLLARMGRAADGMQLCRSYLLQRPDSEPVQAAMRELLPLA